MRPSRVRLSFGLDLASSPQSMLEVAIDSASKQAGSARVESAAIDTSSDRPVGSVTAVEPGLGASENEAAASTFE